MTENSMNRDRGLTPEEDRQIGCFSEGVIKRVAPFGDDTGWSVGFGDGWDCFVPDRGVEPQVGDTLTTFGWLYQSFHGQALNGRMLWYRSPEEVEAEHRAMVARMQAERRAKFEEDREQLDRDYDGLPPLFKMRIDRFRKANPNFRWEYEDYEMFVCTQAVLLAEWASEQTDPTAAIVDWNAKPYKEQLDAISGWSDQHSGNTHGCAVALAKEYVTHRERVPLMMGAMAPLVGSADYSERQ
jgi:hypothetical protein